MALTGADINRACSPMHFVEETLEESSKKIKEHKRKLTEAQKVRSPFLIGSIDMVNKRISRLDRKLQSYTELVVESRASEKSEDFVRPPSTTLRGSFSMKEKETKEVNQFAGIYSLKSTFLSKPSERARNINRISMQSGKSTAKKDSGKPKFVELHQYPGYTANEITPLPNDTPALAILTKTAKAQQKFDKMPQYRPEFEKLFYSQMSQAVLQDLFWWVFLEKWQANKHFQHKLFNRVAHNYVKLLTYANHPQYRDKFLRDYPSLLSQAVYAAYCGAFPDSYRQFDNDFKEDLVVLIYEWVTGCRPAPRTWLQWNTDELEPVGLKNREELIKQTKQKDNSKKSSVLNFDLVEMGNMTASQSTLNNIGSVSSVSSMQGGKRQRNNRKVGGKHKNEKTQNGSNGSSGSERDNNNTLIQEVAVQEKSLAKVRSKNLDPHREERLDPLTPIREFVGEEDGEVSPLGKVSVGYVKSYASISHKKRDLTESHPVGKGPTFVRSVFNTCGQSPLVAHFLRMKNLNIEAGMHLRMQRTEITDLPPLDSKTYRDVMCDSFKKIKDTEKQFQSLDERGRKDGTKFVRKLKAEMKDYIRKETALLAKPREVKRLSDLIMLEMKKDEDSITAGADAAIEAALLAQELV